MNKQPIDLVLFRKICESGNMLDTEIASLFGVSEMKIRHERSKLGMTSPKKITCNVCKEPNTPNVYNSEYPGICIKCRVELGIETRTWSGGRPMSKPKTIKRTCLKCDRTFESPLGYGGKPTHFLCERCNFINGFLGDAEEVCTLRI